MSFLDRIAAAVMPAASDEDRAEARRRAELLATSEPWLDTILRQHKEIERLVTQAMSARGTDARREAARQMAAVLTGHSTAEEAVLYPDVAEFSGKVHAGMGYEEHAMTKVQVAKLEKIDPASDQWRKKLEHIQGALQQHMYQEEASWLPDLAESMSEPEKARLTRRFTEEYERYCGSDSAVASADNRPAMPLNAAP